MKTTPFPKPQGRATQAIRLQIRTPPVFHLPTGLAHQRQARRFGNLLARRAVTSGVGRTRFLPARQSPGDQPGDGVATGMIGTETWRQKHPPRDGRRINPTLPKPSCRTKRLEDPILGQQAGEGQPSLPTRLGHRATKSDIPVRPPGLVVRSQPHHPCKRGRFLSSSVCRLTSYESSSAIRV